VEVDLLVSGGLLVTMDPRRRVIDNGGIAISDGRIIMVGSSEDIARAVQPRRILSAERKAVLPGLIDAHAHGGHSLVKTLGAYLPSHAWLQMIEDIYFRATTPDFWYADGMISSLEKAHFGITCGVMMLGNAPRTDEPDYGSALVEGSARVGNRLILSVGPPSPPWPKTFTRWSGTIPTQTEVTYDRCIEVTEELIKRWHRRSDDRVRVMVGTSYLSVPTRHDPFFRAEHLEIAKRQAADVRQLANKYKTFIHSHAYGGVIEHVREFFEGFLGGDVLLAHCTGISDQERDILASFDVKVAHCPKARRIFGGRCPVPELIDAGVTVAIASDAAAPDRTFDLFEAMRTAQRLQRVHFADAQYLPPGKMLEAVTIDAARAVGMDDQIGSLEVGKRADFIMVDLWRPHMVPTIMPLWRLVHEASGQDVTDVFVDGKPIIEAGRCVTTDEDEVLELADREARRMIERAGLWHLTEIPDGFWGRSRYEA
jgi:cytosine/adenosine deaminase-related metal-dependent hydrolase